MSKTIDLSIKGAVIRLIEEEYGLIGDSEHRVYRAIISISIPGMDPQYHTVEAKYLPEKIGQKYQ